MRSGETLKAEALCLAVHPWSRTSHIVRWLTPRGTLATLVKGAVRPKSAFLGQYDLNYTCELVYYARARGELHALRECVPRERRDALRGDWRALVLADYLRDETAALAPHGDEAAEWFDLLAAALDDLAARAPRNTPETLVSALLAFELAALERAGLAPEIAAEKGAFALRGERRMPVSPEAARCLHDPRAEKNLKILLDAARAIGVFYSFHLDSAPDRRRTVLGMISTTTQGTERQL